MFILHRDSEVSYLRDEEELILASFTRRLIEIATVSGACGTGCSPTAALNAMRLPAIASTVTDLSSTRTLRPMLFSTIISGSRTGGFSFAIRTREPFSRDSSIS